MSLAWAPQFEAPLRLACPREDFDEYFEARAEFARLLGDLEAASNGGGGGGGSSRSDLPRDAFLETRLQPGEVLVFNNRRMLHGRRAFSLCGGGVRRLLGAYVNADEWRSRLAVLAHEGYANGAFRMRRVGNGGLA